MTAHIIPLRDRSPARQSGLTDLHPALIAAAIAALKQDVCSYVECPPPPPRCHYHARR